MPYWGRTLVGRRCCWAWDVLSCVVLSRTAMCGRGACCQSKGAWRDPRAGVVCVWRLVGLWSPEAPWCLPVKRSGSCFRAGECRLLSANNEIGASSQLMLSCANSAGLSSSDACWEWCRVIGPRCSANRCGY